MSTVTYDVIVFQVEAHEDDVNAVAFADDTSHILYSGSDDGLCKVRLSSEYLVFF
jgi:WD40 repeat protein